MNKFKMNALALLALGMIASNTASAHTIQSKVVYKGRETVNQVLTGNTCGVLIDTVVAIQNTSHCYEVSMHFGSPRMGFKKNLNVRSQYTKKHESSFPERKTCALNLDGTVAGDAVFDAESNEVYTRFFSGMHKEGSHQYDYFLKFSPETLLPQEAAYHELSWFTDRLVECIDLKAAE